MSIDILLVARDSDTAKTFRVHVENLGARCTVAPTLSDLYRELALQPFHGVFLDSLVTARANDAEKVLVHDLLGRIPVLRIDWEEEHRKISSQLYDGSRAVSVFEFLENYCHPEAPVFIRQEQRLPFYLNVLVAPDIATLRLGPERAVTLDLSESGAFLLTPNDWSAHRTLWIEFCDLLNDDPIEVEICWRIPWGLTKRLPGVGVRFIGIPPSMENELREVLGIIDSAPS